MAFTHTIRYTFDGMRELRDSRLSDEAAALLPGNTSNSGQS